MPSMQVEEIVTEYQVSRLVGDHFEPCFLLEKDDPMPNMNRLPAYRDYVGTYNYRGSLAIKKQSDAWYYLQLPNCSNGAEILVNGESAGLILTDSGKVNITRFLKDGSNVLEIRMANTLIWKRRDHVSPFVQIRATGLTERPKLYICRK